MLVLALTTSFLFMTAISPVLMYDSLAQLYGSSQKMMFSSICHQQLDRTIHIQGIPAAVCARCLGIYAFLSIGFVIVPIFKRFFNYNFRYSKALLFMATIVLLTDYSMQWIGMYEGSNFSRFLTGSALGASTAIFIIYKK